MFEIIKKWRIAFNLPVKDKFKLPPKDEFNLAVSLIREELEELIEAYNKKDRREYLDAGADLEYVIKQLHFISGYNIVKAVKRVYYSNMSKVCTSKEDVDKSIEKYNNQGIDVYIKQVDSLYFIHRKSDNKLLKGVHFKEPYLEDLL